MTVMMQLPGRILDTGKKVRSLARFDQRYLDGRAFEGFLLRHICSIANFAMMTLARDRHNRWQGETAQVLFHASGTQRRIDTLAVD
jgi:hypothetical protein